MPTQTITTTAPQAQRVATAFGAKLNLGRDATAAEVKADVIAYMRNVVINYEREEAQKQIVDSAFDPT
jgi:hypothetical protein